MAVILNHNQPMSSGVSNLPRVSVIMPTLNVEALLDNTLAAIARQTYPRNRCEIILADAHSTDRTREIAAKYGAIVLDDNGKNMEEGKRLALRHATGDFILFVDADNELTHPDYLELAVQALAANPQALGVEGYYLASPKMSSFCAYLTHRLHISDPICWLMSANPELVARASRAGGVVIDTEGIWDREQEEFLRRRGRVYDRSRTNRCQAVRDC